MSTIELYEILKKIPNVSDEQAKSVADMFAHTDDVVTKADVWQICFIVVGVLNTILFLALRFTG